MLAESREFSTTQRPGPGLMHCSRPIPKVMNMCSSTLRGTGTQCGPVVKPVYTFIYKISIRYQHLNLTKKKDIHI